MKPGISSTPAIRLIGALMLLFSLGVPVGLYWAQQVGTTDVKDAHHPERLERALKTFESAIRAAGQHVPEDMSAESLAKALDLCASDFGKLGEANGFDTLYDYVQGVNQNLLALSGGASGGNRLLSSVYSIDSAVWLGEVNAGINAHRFSCSDLLNGARWMAGAEGRRLLSEARWAEFQRQKPSPGHTTEHKLVEFSANALRQTDPWKGWPGCVWLKSANPSEQRAWYIAPSSGSRWGRALCEQNEMRPAGAQIVAAATRKVNGSPVGKDDTAWFIPESLDVLLAELESLRMPTGAYYQDLAHSVSTDGNRRKIGRVDMDVGYNIQLTIDPAAQKYAQQIARCYTGDRDICRMIGLDADAIGAGRVAGKLVYPGAKEMWEGAAARMTAIAILDVASGRIEALASAHTNCYRQEFDGPGREENCAPLWTTPRHRPDALLNHAVFEDYFPGSTVKPIMASVFLEEPSFSVDAIQREIAKSDSIAFIDHMFCVDKSEAQRGKVCDRPTRIQQRAADLGWNLGCGDAPRADCGHLDLLFGRPSYRRTPPEGNAPSIASRSPLSRDVLLGRTLVEQPLTPKEDKGSGGFQLNSHLAFNVADARACARQKWNKDGAQCQGIGNLGRLRSEGYGQGESRATVIGVAGMVARLTAASQGKADLQLPHLVEQISDVHGKPVQTIATRSADGKTALARSENINIKPDLAQKVLVGMAMGSKIGTGYNTCVGVFGKSACEQGGLNFAGKTGTTSFNFDEATMDYVSRVHCNSKTWGEACDQRPMKWYVAAYDSKAIVSGGKANSVASSRSYDKVIAVLTERNWYGPKSHYPNRVHGLKADGAVNISAEIGMQIMAKVGQVEGGVKR